MSKTVDSSFASDDFLLEDGREHPEALPSSPLKLEVPSPIPLQGTKSISSPSSPTPLLRSFASSPPRNGTPNTSSPRTPGSQFLTLLTSNHQNKGSRANLLPVNSVPSTPLSGMEREAVDRKAQRFLQQTLCAFVFLVIVIILGTVLGVTISNQASRTEEIGLKTPKPTFQPTETPTTTCIMKLPPFSSNLPWSFLVRFLSSDLCLNYPLDCFSQGSTSYPSLFGASLEDGKWSFQDDVNVRLSSATNEQIIRLEVRHAHDPLRDLRAFVYSFAVRSVDSCLLRFSSYQVSTLTSGRIQCSNSIDQAATHSNIVSQFVKNPTRFMDKSDGKFTVSTPIFNGKVTTTTAPILSQFLVGIDSSQVSPSYYISEARNTPLDALLTTDSTLSASTECLKGGSWVDLFFKPLIPRTQLMANLKTNYVSGGDCTKACLSSKSLSATNGCITTCLTQQISKLTLPHRQLAESNLTPESEITRHLVEMDRLAPATPAEVIEAELIEEKRDGEDEQLLICLVASNPVYNGGALPKQNAASLITALSSLKQTTDNVQNKLNQLNLYLVQATNFLFGYIQKANTNYLAMSNLKARFVANMKVIATFSANSNTRTLAANVLKKFNADYDATFFNWGRYLAAYVWSGSDQDLNAFLQAALNVQQARVNVIKQNLVLNRYIIPIIQATGSTDQLEATARSALQSVLNAEKGYDNLQFNMFDFPNALAIAYKENTLNQIQAFTDESTEFIQILNQIVLKLDAALDSKTSQNVVYAQNVGNQMSVTDACNLQKSCEESKSCLSINSNIIQLFGSPSTTSCPTAKCTPIPATCQEKVLVPSVELERHTFSVREALETYHISNNEIETTITNSLKGWSEMPFVTAGSPQIYTATTFDHIFDQVVNWYTRLTLPTHLNCLSSNIFGTTLLCQPFNQITAAVSVFCGVPPGAACVGNLECTSGSCKNGTCCVDTNPLCNSCVVGSGLCATKAPSKLPTMSPTKLPTAVPSKSPTYADTFKPTINGDTSPPTFSPTVRTLAPSLLPTKLPSKSPTTKGPSVSPILLSEYTPGPTRMPAKTKKPSNSPTQYPTTLAPSLSPTKRPTTRNPTVRTESPSRAPTVITPNPTRLPTTSPTIQPTLAPIATLCQRPPETCEKIVNQDSCNFWSGCTWDVDLQKCQTQECSSEFLCRIQHYTFLSSPFNLPSCRLGDDLNCDKQRRRIFDQFQLDSLCSAPFVKAENGGAWRGAEVSQPVISSKVTDIYVSASKGSDRNSGNRVFPLASIEKAVELSRLQNRKTIYLLPDAPFRLNNTIVLDERDNGLSIIGQTDSTTNARPRLTNMISISNNVWQATGNPNIIRTQLSREVMAQLGDLSALNVADSPAVRARHPNIIDPLKFAYSGKSTIQGYGRAATTRVTKTINRVIAPFDNPKAQYQPASTRYNQFFAGYDGACSHFSPPVSYFCHPNNQAQGGCPYTFPGSVQVKMQTRYTDITTGYFHWLHWYGWGLWTFKIQSGNTNGQMSFGRGGFQEARGDCGFGGGDWWLENIFELLDYPNEFFLDMKANYLYYYPPNDAKNPIINPFLKMEIGSSLRNFIEVRGTSASNPVNGVTIRNIEFFGGYATHMDTHEVPSGGDWSIHRGALVFFENIENSQVQDSFFNHCGGNGVFVSKYARNVNIERNEFFALGATAILVVGDAGFLTPDPWIIKSYPMNVKIFGNVASDVGLVVKQSAGAFVSIAKRVIIEQNTFYNGPRGGIVLNDGFGGGHKWLKNIVFRMVIETNDHGPVDTWDRQQWQEDYLRETNEISENLILGSKKGPKGIDLDDGAYNFLCQNNVIVWGYQKFKGSFIRSLNNLILYPADGGCAFVTPQTRTPANWEFKYNTCVSFRPPFAYNAGPAELSSLCTSANFDSDYNSFYYLDRANSFEACSPGTISWSNWKSKYKNDEHSTFSRTAPSIDQMEQWVKAKLTWTQI